MQPRKFEGAAEQQQQKQQQQLTANEINDATHPNIIGNPYTSSSEGGTVSSNQT